MFTNPDSQYISTPRVQSHDHPVLGAFGHMTPFSSHQIQQLSHDAEVHQPSSSSHICCHMSPFQTLKNTYQIFIQFVYTRPAQLNMMFQGLGVSCFQWGTFSRIRYICLSCSNLGTVPLDSVNLGTTSQEQQCYNALNTLCHHGDYQHDYKRSKS